MYRPPPPKLVSVSSKFAIDVVCRLGHRRAGLPSPDERGSPMVYQPTRGDGPLRLGPTVKQVPELGGTTLTADVYRDPERFEQEREKVLRYSWLIAGRSEEIPNRGDWLL